MKIYLKIIIRIGALFCFKCCLFSLLSDFIIPKILDLSGWTIERTAEEKSEKSNLPRLPRSNTVPLSLQRPEAESRLRRSSFGSGTLAPQQNTIFPSHLAQNKGRMTGITSVGSHESLVVTLNEKMSKVEKDVAVRFILIGTKWLEAEREVQALLSLEGVHQGPVSD